MLNEEDEKLVRIQQSLMQLSTANAEAIEAAVARAVTDGELEYAEAGDSNPGMPQESDDFNSPEGAPEVRFLHFLHLTRGLSSTLHFTHPREHDASRSSLFCVPSVFSLAAAGDCWPQ